MAYYVQGGESVWTTAFFLQYIRQTFADLILYISINNSDDSISMTRGASPKEDYLWNLLIRHQFAVFPNTPTVILHVRESAF